MAINLTETELKALCTAVLRAKLPTERELDIAARVSRANGWGDFKPWPGNPRYHVSPVGQVRGPYKKILIPDRGRIRLSPSMRWVNVDQMVEETFGKA